ncbi:outer membrane protein, partial [Novosphingobium sp. B-7]|uniref:outer membrane protein n=1 Tax=Novosphingobium sp. B-7 TaxID=1298855 RepID=UPI0005BE7AA0
MRKLILGLALASSAMATPALAKSKSWYVEGDGGVMLLEDADHNVNGTANAATVSSKTGYDFGGVVGYDFGGFRLETEASYRRARNSNVRNNVTGAVYSRDNGQIGGSTSALSFMVNGLLDFGPDDGLQGFIGGGAGVAKAKYYVATPDGLLDDSKTKFAWQVLAGVRAPLSKHVDVGLKYRFFNVQDVNLVGTSGAYAGANFSTRLRSHSILGTLTYNFGGEEQAPPPPPPPPPP